MINCMSKQEFRRWEKQNVNCSRERERRPKGECAGERGREVLVFYLFILENKEMGGLNK